MVCACRREGGSEIGEPLYGRTLGSCVGQVMWKDENRREFVPRSVKAGILAQYLGEKNIELWK